MENEKILPVEEMLAYEEFTDRVEILRELDTWVKRIQRMTAPSTAIIAPRRMGKTVLLDRLVNTVFFKSEYKVAPFYLRVKREDTTLRKFLLEYATTFFRQYIAYCLQDPVLYRDDKIELEQLLEHPSAYSSIDRAAISQAAIDRAKEFIEGFLRRYNNRRYDDTRNQWDGFIRAPEQLGSLSGIRVAVIIDEFQDMNFYVHDVDEENIERIRNERLSNPGLVGVKLTSTYDRQAQSRKAPMLVSGSAVTLIFRTVMGGPLGGRFGFKYLKPLSISDGAILLQTLLPLYSDQPEITPENAMYASGQTGGHPYYLYCLSISDYEAKSFDGRDAIDELIHYEITQGKIYGFWQTHFEDNRKTINMDTDEQTGRKIIYYFTKYNNQPVEIKEIAEKLSIPKKIVEKKIEQLYQADLVYKTKARFYTFNDICLMRYIKFVYEQDLEDVDEIDLSQRNLFNTLKGKFLEMLVQVTMMKFNHEKLDGAFFGRKGQIELPRFQYVNTRTVKGLRTAQYQIDIFGKELKQRNRVWLCECKYTKRKMGIAGLEKLEKACEALKQEEEGEGLTIPEVRMWLVSTGGFTEELINYVKDREDIYISDYEGINRIFQAYGGNYRIPVFRD